MQIQEREKERERERERERKRERENLDCLIESVKYSNLKITICTIRQ